LNKRQTHKDTYKATVGKGREYMYRKYSNRATHDYTDIEGRVTPGAVTEDVYMDVGGVENV